MGQRVQLSRAKLQEHIEGLCAAYKIFLVQPDDFNVEQSCHYSLSNPRNGQKYFNVVLIPRVTTELIYAAALHELGHAIHPLGSTDIKGANKFNLRMDAEHYAWEWARANALVWTRGMQDAREISETSYQRTQEQFKRRRQQLEALAKQMGLPLDAFDLFLGGV